jgi:hypothetical protein
MTTEQLSLFDDSSSAASSVVLEQDGVARDPGSAQLEELLNTLDVVDVDDQLGYMIMAERHRDAGVTEGSALREFGYTAPSPFTSWTRRDDNTKLREHQGLHTYYNMRRQDGAIRASMRLLKTPVQGAHWFIEPFTTDDNTPATTQDKNIASFVADNIFERLNVPWATLLSDILLFADYGYMCFEKVYLGDDPDGKLRLTKLAPRHPLDIQEWDYDQNGGPNGCIMYSNPYSGASLITPGTGMTPSGFTGGTVNGSASLPSERFIPVKKLVVFSHEPEAGDITGISVLRSAYKHWYYKDTLYKIDAIQKERHGIGIPVIKLPPGFSKEDQALADNLGRNLRTNERAHVTLPPLWDLIFAKLEGQPVDCMKSIEHHDMRIKSNVLGSFMDATTGTQDSNVDIFLKSTRYLAEYICDIFNKFVIKQLVDLNFTLAKNSTRGYPRLRARRIGEWEDIRTLSFAIRNLVSIDAIRPDDVMEAQLRREMDLPPADPKTARTPMLVKPPTGQEPSGNPGDKLAPQPGSPTDPNNPNAGQDGSKQNMNANKVGGPRQTPSALNKPGGNAGRDASGGK